MSPHPRAHSPPLINFPSIAKFTAFVQLKDFRGPIQKEYARYLHKLGEHYACDPATLTEDQLRAYFLFLRQEKKFGGSAMKLARCALRAFFRDCLHIAGWTVFEEVRIAPPHTLPLVLPREQVAALLAAVRQPRYRTALTLIYHHVKGFASRGQHRPARGRGGAPSTARSARHAHPPAAPARALRPRKRLRLTRLIDAADASLSRNYAVGILPPNESHRKTDPVTGFRARFSVTNR